jgi:hypothetical protein
MAVLSRRWCRNSEVIKTLLEQKSQFTKSQVESARTRLSPHNIMVQSSDAVWDRFVRIWDGVRCGRGCDLLLSCTVVCVCVWGGGALKAS